MITYRTKTEGKGDYKITLIFAERQANNKGIQEEIGEILKTKAIRTLQSKTKALQFQSKIKEKEGNVKCE